MKVALLKSDASKKGGIEKYTHRLAQAFQEKGCQVTILTTGNTNDTLMHSFGKLSGPNFIRLRKFDSAYNSWIEKNSPHVVFGMDRNSHQTHYRAGNGVHAAYLSKRAEDCSWLKSLSFRLNPLHCTILKFEKQTYEDPQLKALFTNSEMVKKEILTYYNTDPKKIHVVHNGVEWHEMESAFSMWQEVKQEGPYHFLFVGNEYKRKGLPQLLRALARVTEPFHLTVVGKERNPKPYYELAEKLNISRHITFCGSQENIYPYYQNADALVVPSTYDPFANVTVEALAMGLFVISSRDNGGCEVLTPETGIAIDDVNQSESFAAVLSKAIKKPKTEEQAKKIRNAVSYLDFGKQLNKIVEITLNHAG